MLTKKEMLEYLRISKGTLDKMMRKREIPFHKIGKRVLFKKSDIDRWLESKRVK
ncbi:MAG: helix-turn-helix domain-containing protein [Candidatus Aminicenantales bacterium]